MKGDNVSLIAYSNKYGQNTPRIYNKLTYEKYRKNA